MADEEEARRQRAEQEKAARAFRAEQAQRLWAAAAPMTDADGLAYLRARGIELETWPRDLAFLHGKMTIARPPGEGDPYTTNGWALAVGLRSVDNPGLRGSVIGVQTIPLDRQEPCRATYRRGEQQGQKVDKKTIGNARGSAFKVTRAAKHMLVCEGPENALSLAQAMAGTDVAVWAMVGASMFASFEPPAVVEQLWIMADNDKPGMKAAWALRDRMKKKVLKPGQKFHTTIVPSRAATDDAPAADWNDLLQELGADGLRSWIRDAVRGQKSDVQDRPGQELITRDDGPPPAGPDQGDPQDGGGHSPPPDEPPGSGGGAGGMGGIPYASELLLAGRVIARLRDMLDSDIVYADGELWCYVPAEGRWKTVPDDVVRDEINREDGTTAGRKAIGMSDRLQEALQRMIRKELHDPEFFEDPRLGMNVRNGFLAFERDGSYQLLPHHESFRRRDLVDAEFVTDEAGLEPERRLLDNLLSSRNRSGDAEMPFAEDARMAIHEHMAVAALGISAQLENPRALILYGSTSGTGKSEVVRLFEKLVPADRIGVISLGALNDPVQIAAIAGKSLLVAHELSSSSKVAPDKFKAIITHNEVLGRILYRGSMMVQPIAQVVVSTNELPDFVTYDEAITRRLSIIPFHHPISDAERVANIADRIWADEAERSMLLHRVVEAASRVVRTRTLTTVELFHKTLARQAGLESDPCYEFAATEIVQMHAVGDEEKGLERSTLVKAARAWAEAQGYEPRQIVPRRLYAAIRSIFGEVDYRYRSRSQSGAPVRTFFGLRLRPGFSDAYPTDSFRNRKDTPW